MTHVWRAAALVLLGMFAPAHEAAAADAPPTANLQIRPIDAAWITALPHDADAATKAYLDRLPPEVVARAQMNLILRAATADIRSSSSPCFQREMLVAP